MKYPIDITPSGILSFVKVLTFKNALSPITVTVFGMLHLLASFPSGNLRSVV